MPTITLTRETTDSVVLDYLTPAGAHVWPIKVTSVVTNNDTETPLDSNIFVCQLSGTGYDPATGDYFNGVASAVEMNEIPLKSNNATMNEKSTTNNFMPYYRVDSVVLMCGSVDERESVWETICDAAKDLKYNWVLQDNTQEDGKAVI